MVKKRQKLVNVVVERLLIRMGWDGGEGSREGGGGVHQRLRGAPGLAGRGGAEVGWCSREPRGSRGDPPRTGGEER